MKTTVVILLATILAMVLLNFAKSQRVDIPDTGINDHHKPQAAGMSDQHFMLISSPIEGRRTMRAVVGGKLPPTYLHNTAKSLWIGPEQDLSQNFPPGMYHYRTAFDLSGCDLASTVITGRLASDNHAEIQLNGHDIGFESPDDGFEDFTDFTIKSGFHSGSNVIDLMVHNLKSSPTAVRVEFTGNASSLAFIFLRKFALVAGIWRSCFSPFGTSSYSGGHGELPQDFRSLLKSYQ